MTPEMVREKLVMLLQQEKHRRERKTRNNVLKWTASSPLVTRFAFEPPQTINPLSSVIHNKNVLEGRWITTYHSWSRWQGFEDFPQSHKPVVTAATSVLLPFPR